MTSKSIKYIYFSDTSNWMRFVRPALTYKEQNLVICQQKGGIVFLTTKNILPKEELRAGPHPDYAARRNLTVLKPDVKDDKGINNYICILILFYFFFFCIYLFYIIYFFFY